jgi:AraC family transcriptional regulator
MNNSILHAKSNSFYWKGTGSLSIKTFRNDRAYYNAGGGHFVVEEGKYLLLNSGQEYSLLIESECPVESFCIFFSDGLAEDVVRTLTMADIDLLDEPFGFNNSIAKEFIEKTYPAEGWFSSLLERFRLNYTSGMLENGEVETYLHAFMQGLVVEQFKVRREMRNFSTIKSSTRTELYKRVQIGHEYMTAYFWRPLLLDEVSRIACLSPNHFVRNYKKLFGITPTNI